MTRSPARPVTPALDSDGIVRLRGGDELPRFPRTSPHPLGTTLLPTGLPVEQDILWMFPALNAQALSPITVRDHLRQAWLYTVGTAFHRAFVAGVALRPDWQSTARAAGERAIAALGRLGEPTGPTVDVVAGLETHIDVFGAPTDALVDSISWGFDAEFRLADEYGDTFRQTSTDIVRYRSRAALFEQERELIGHRFGALTQQYTAAAYDIVACWTDRPNLASEQLRQQARRLGRDLVDRLR